MILKKCVRFLSSLLLLSAVALAQEGKWLDLFPDEKLTGWTRVAIPPTKPVSDIPQWKVDTANRIIICEGNGGHEWLRYDREFANFIYHVEWRFTRLEGTPKYNSGVFFRNDKEGNIWHQAQAGLAGGYIFAVTPVNGTAQRIDLRSKMTENRVKPAGEWNVYDIRADGRHVRYP